MLVYGKYECSSCRCGMFVSFVYPMAVLNAQFCMNCSLSMLVENARSDHMEEAYFRDCLIGSHECLILFTPSCCCECLYNL